MNWEILSLFFYVYSCTLIKREGHTMKRDMPEKRKENSSSFRTYLYYYLGHYFYSWFDYSHDSDICDCEKPEMLCLFYSFLFQPALNFSQEMMVRMMMITPKRISSWTQEILWSTEKNSRGCLTKKKKYVWSAHVRDVLCIKCGPLFGDYYFL